MKLLQINASARTEGANSTRVANAVVERLREASPDSALKVRDLAKDPAPALDDAPVAARDALIAEVQAADALVLRVPMYNLGNPVQLKGWIDALARAGVTFRYTSYLRSILGFLGITDVRFI